MKSQKPKNILLVILCLLGIVSALVYIIASNLTGDGMELISLFSAILMPVGTGLLLFSYQTHRKNLMKALIGALLMYQLTLSMAFLSSGMQSSLFAMNGIDNPVLFLLEIVNFIMYLIIFVNHFILNESRKSHPTIATISQVALFLLLVSFIAQIVVSTLFGKAVRTPGELTAWIAAYVRDWTLMAAVVWIESKLDYYREVREEKALAGEGVPKEVEEALAEEPSADDEPEDK